MLDAWLIAGAITSGFALLSVTLVVKVKGTFAFDLNRLWEHRSGLKEITRHREYARLVRMARDVCPHAQLAGPRIRGVVIMFDHESQGRRRCIMCGLVVSCDMADSLVERWNNQHGFPISGRDHGWEKAEFWLAYISSKFDTIREGAERIGDPLTG